MSDELLKFFGSVAMSVGGVWVALHKKMENIATRLKAAEDDVREIKVQHEKDLQDVRHRQQENEAVLAEMRAQHSASMADIKNLTTHMAEVRADVKTLILRGHQNAKI